MTQTFPGKHKTAKLHLVTVPDCKQKGSTIIHEPGLWSWSVFWYMKASRSRGPLISILKDRKKLYSAWKPKHWQHSAIQILPLDVTTA
jgi:hypothetical protein